MNNEYLPISRRRLLEGTFAAGAAGFLDAFPSQTAFAKAPMVNTQAPYFYRFKLGNFEGTIVLGWHAAARQARGQFRWFDES